MTIEELALPTRGGVLRALQSPGRSAEVPLVVGLHGAAYDARYFSAPGRSVHELVAARGWSMLSITRPGYPADATSAAHQPCLADAAELVSEAVAVACERLGAAAVVLLGHSVGGAVAVHVAASAPSWPLRLLAFSGVSDAPAAGPVAAFGGLPATVPLELSFTQCRPVFYGPDEWVGADGAQRFADLIVTTPSRDVVEVNTTWPSDLAARAPRVTVPVHHVMAEHDALWDVGDDAVGRVLALFTAAPAVSGRLWPRTGHNIEHHTQGAAYVADVLDVASRWV